MKLLVIIFSLTMTTITMASDNIVSLSVSVPTAVIYGCATNYDRDSTSVMSCR